jgi:hypothetical protein
MAKLLVQVCGDPAVDWLSIQSEDLPVSGGAFQRLSDHPAAVARLCSQAGGSALVLQFLRERNPPELAEVEGRPLDAGLLEQPRDSQITTTWTGWRAIERVPALAGAEAMWVLNTAGSGT